MPFKKLILIVAALSIFSEESCDAAAQIRLEPYISGLHQPVYITGDGDDSQRLFILEKNLGRIRIVDTSGIRSRLLPGPYLDIGRLVSTQSEQGLLGLAFHPKFRENGRFFIHYTDNRGDTVVAEYRQSAQNPNLANSAQKVILRQKQPYSNHNGGTITFGPDGFLYIGLGDGGAGGDPHDHGQNTDTLLGSILRIDIDRGDPYASPPDNPFAGGKPGRDEIYSYGLRNPYRFSFDRGGTHQLFCGDVGQDKIEEIDIVVRGGNYGWRILEGTRCFSPPMLCDKEGKIPPIHEYGRERGNCSVTGGYVYRGSQVPALAGKYVFADFCTGIIWALEQTSSGEWKSEEIFDAPFNISSFGEDDSGELYVIEFHGGSEATSRIHRIRAH